jgi:trans-2,3-dihydro-3-hydroxyanthranilate isomerase
MRSIEYMIYDVFTEKALTGNQLGVILDASGLSGVQMQAIAREFNIAETIFFLPPENPEHAAKVRIFMPLGELPFAGHPTIGGAIAFAGKNRLAMGAKIVLEEEVGPIACVVSADEFGGKSSFIAVRLPEELPFNFNVIEVCKALNLDPKSVGFDDHQITLTSGGVPYVTVPVKTLDDLANAKVDADKWLTLDVHKQGKFAAPYLYCRERQGIFRVRMFAPWDGIPEDPATGSAAVAFAKTLKKFEFSTDGNHKVTINQGVEMGRPSQICLSLRIENSNLSSVEISGSAVKVAEGRLFL